KRDALIAGDFAMVKSSLAARRALAEASREAYFALFLANAWGGPESDSSLAMAGSSQSELSRKRKDMCGGEVPQVQTPSFDATLPFSPVGAGASTLEAAGQFRKLVEAIINVAATETRLRRIGEEIKKTSRRVNALEQLVIPGINYEIRQIR